MVEFIRKIKNIKLFWIIACVLFIIPFFWLAPGQMDLGGDANRLYFWDPLHFIKSTALFDIVAEGKGAIGPKYFYLPYVGIIAFLKLFLSSTIIISIFNGLKLSVGFISIYLISAEVLHNTWGEKKKKIIEISAILSGLFYIVSLVSIHTAFFWNRALFTHDQVFLNPLMFYLLFKFILSHKYKYVFIFLMISFIFSTNFSLLSSGPPMFAFYPLAIIFLLICSALFVKKPIPWKGIVLGLLLFLGIHSFHLLGEVVSIFDSNSVPNSIIFSKSGIEQGGLGYFDAVHGYGKAILNLFLPSDTHFIQWTSLLFPCVLIFGFILDGKKKQMLLITIFFLITFFLSTANVTSIGFELYRKLFYIPGFSMFRNFYTQWMYLFIFFYSLLFGFSIYNILIKLKLFYFKLLYRVIFILLIITGIPLFLGWPINKTPIRGSNNVPSVLVMDPQYADVLEFVRSLPDDGKVMVLPLTDYFRQVIYGQNGGAYEGPSTLLHLTDKYSFVGYQHFGYGENIPYAEDIMKYSRGKNYYRLLEIFSILNIKYILHDSDPNIYEKNFPSGGPYPYMMTSLPKTQEEYTEFLTHFPVHIIYRNGPYTIYELDRSSYNPTIFIPDGIYQSNKLSFDKNLIHDVFIDTDTCIKKNLNDMCNGYKTPDIKLSSTMINPTVYKVNVTNVQEESNVLLVLQHTYHSAWKVHIDGEVVDESKHIVVNGYANGWVINNLPKKKEFTIEITMDQQKYFWYGWYITISSLVILVGTFLIDLFIKKQKQ